MAMAPLASAVKVTISYQTELSAVAHHSKYESSTLAAIEDGGWSFSYLHLVILLFSISCDGQGILHKIGIGARDGVGTLRKITSGAKMPFGKTS